MITIQFRHEKDALIIYEQIRRKDKQTELSLQLIKEPEALLKISWQDPESIDSIVIPVLADYIMSTVEVIWMKDMIKQLFYYHDLEEQEQILSIARAILDGEKTDIPEQPATSRYFYINEAFSTFLTNRVSFSFESFLLFRLKEYREQLVKYVECAIDEYKLEQEYQNFIESLRQYVSEKESDLEKVYLVFDGSFSIFDEKKDPISKEKLRGYIDQQLSKMEEIDLESLVIAPLISISPKRLAIYTNDADNGIILTIQNIFLERVSIYDLAEF